MAACIDVYVIVDVLNLADELLVRLGGSGDMNIK